MLTGFGIFNITNVVDEETIVYEFLSLKYEGRIKNYKWL